MDMKRGTRHGDSECLSWHENVCNSGELARWHRLYLRCRIGGFIEHRFPEENPERFRTLLISAHSRNRLKLESQDDGNEKICGRQTVTIAHVRRVGMRHSNGIPERLVCHTTTSHVASMVRQ